MLKSPKYISLPKTLIKSNEFSVNSKKPPGCHSIIPMLNLNQIIWEICGKKVSCDCNLWIKVKVIQTGTNVQYSDAYHHANIEGNQSVANVQT